MSEERSSEMPPSRLPGAQIADGSLRGFSDKDELLDYLQRPHRRSA